MPFFRKPNSDTNESLLPEGTYEVCAPSMGDGESRFAHAKNKNGWTWAEGRACRVRRTTLDHPFHFNGHDKRAPPIQARHACPPIQAQHACPSICFLPDLRIWQTTRNGHYQQWNRRHFNGSNIDHPHSLFDFLLRMQWPLSASRTCSAYALPCPLRLDIGRPEGKATTLSRPNFVHHAFS